MTPKEKLVALADRYDRLSGTRLMITPAEVEIELRVG